MKEKEYGFERQNCSDMPELLHLYRHETEPFVVAALQPETSLQWEEPVPKEEWLSQFDCRYLLVTWTEQEEERLLFLSGSKQIRALELLDYMIPEFGLVKGDAGQAWGKISSAVLKVRMSDVDLRDPYAFFVKTVASYYVDCDRIDAAVYGVEQEDAIRRAPVYRKKKIPWAYVRSTDAVEAGQPFLVRSLENESGVVLVSDPDVYIMIGCRGEAYDIRRDKFEATYEPTDEELDVFAQMLDFLPEIECVAQKEYISIDEKAHLCYPKAGNGIYARQLKRRTKVFPADGTGEYYLGRPGDYLAIRRDDLTDIYIIQGDIFQQTYEEQEG